MTVAVILCCELLLVYIFICVCAHKQNKIILFSFKIQLSGFTRMTDLPLPLFTIQYLIITFCLILSALSQHAQNYSPRRYPRPDYLDSDKYPGYFSPPGSQHIDVEKSLQKLNHTPFWVPTWPDPSTVLGQLSAVSLDMSGNVVVFHRGDRVWGKDTFTSDNLYVDENRGPIESNTIVVLNAITGKVVSEWGSNLFYMPHGLTVDTNSNVWITDVALHQVMKFKPNGEGGRPVLVLGERFSPGMVNRFCKPTAVAVMITGDFFVSDGYCNSRIIKFSSSGIVLNTWGTHTFQGVAPAAARPYAMAIPHALALAEEKDMICVADRENGRVQCFSASNGTYIEQFHSPLIGDRLFSVAYSPINGGQLYVVNGPELSGRHVRGFVISMSSGQILSQFGPNNLDFSNPHDIAVSNDGTQVYAVELNPYKVHKFVATKTRNNAAFHYNSSLVVTEDPSNSFAKPTATVDKQSLEQSGIITLNEAVSFPPQPTATLLITATLLVVLVALVLGLAALISRRRKRGCLPVNSQRNRRRAWDAPAHSTGIKFSHLIERRTRDGFEKLNTEESEDEATPTTSMLATPQFA